MPSPAADGEIKPPAYDPHCQRPRTKDDSDLCAQWSAVEAVKESNRVAQIALRAGAFEFGALLLSIIFTAWAALAAVKAAQAADRAVDETRKAAHLQLRAYITASKGKVRLHKRHPDVLMVQISITNRGQTPADDVQASLDLWVDHLTDTFVPPEERDRTLMFGSVGPGSEISVSKGYIASAEEIEAIYQYKMVLGVRLSLRYRLYDGSEIHVPPILYTGTARDLEKRTLAVLDPEGLKEWALEAAEADQGNLKLEHASQTTNHAPSPERS
jgi:hypothetical protein